MEPSTNSVPVPGAISDSFGRPLRSLRLSVTDRCNLRCAYCMPEEDYDWLPKSKLLRFEEISLLVDAFVELGVSRLRLTGGEPLLRRDLPRLVAMLAAKPAIRDLALTTNALLLAEQGADLVAAGCRRVTISLDTLQPDRFRELTRRDGLDQALAGIEAAGKAGFASVKLNMVVMRGTNDDEIGGMLRFARERGCELRFVEYMDVGGATAWSQEHVVSRAEILASVESAFGDVEVCERSGTELAAPAERFRLADGTVFGIIASTTTPFCGSCDRARLTADGQWFRCLYAQKGFDIGSLLRQGAGQAELVEAIAAVWRVRTDRGAEERLAQLDRSPLAGVDTLRADPHLEMHTRGG